MSEYETYSEKKWLERHGIGEDSFYLRETYGRIKNKSGRKHCGCKSIMNHLYDVMKNYLIGINMDKWKELSAGKKRFWVAVGIIVIVAVVGWVTGWWSSPDVPVS